MDKKEIWRGISIVCITIGFCVGYLTLKPLLNLLKPNPEYSFVIYSPGQNVGVVFYFSILSGLLLGLVPFLGNHLNGSTSKSALPFALIMLAGLSGSLLLFFYLKFKYLKIANVAKGIGFESSMQFPPMFLIPLSGIILILLVFLILKYIFKNKNLVNPVNPV